MSAQSDTANEKRRRVRESIAAKNNRERNKLSKLVAKHGGNRSAIARALCEAGEPITRQGISAKLKRHGLIEEADRLSVASCKPGPRNNVPSSELRRQKEELMHALGRVKTYDEAPALLGYSPATMYRLIKQFGITVRQVEKRRMQKGYAGYAK